MTQGLEIVRGTRFGYGIAWAQRALGRIAQAEGAFPEAETHLKEALHGFESIEARFEIGRTHLALAELAGIRRDMSAASMHLVAAHQGFRALRAPRYVERSEALATRLRITVRPE